ncbi:putative quinol monooxygenase [Novosphingobium sp.]|uniref:putative quinol monooxygenase n=1 Tax=Novosphingobium sp. TaxID=1874826 RepID=UPI0025E8EBD5|nr:putative quinol monooxygenase [Novosphingobium sp.]
MIIITGSAILKPETRDAAIVLGAEHSARSRAEPGCIAHNVHIDAEDPRRLVFLELWADLASVKTHFAVPASGAFVRALSGMTQGPPEMKIFEAEDVTAALRG